MKRRILSYVLIASVSLVIGGILQPLNHLQALANPAQQGTCQDFKETGKKLCGKFLTYWQANGGLRQQGFPISNEFREKSDLNGQEYTVQYFERAVFELHPELQAPNDVLLSQLGTFWARSKYGNPPRFPGEGAVPTPPTAKEVDLGVEVPILRDGMTIQLTEVDIKNWCGNGDPEAAWVFRLKNGSKAPVTMTVDANSLAMRDDTGKTYKTAGDCAFYGNYGIWERDRTFTMTPGQNASGNIVFTAVGVPPTATYLYMTFNISGQQLNFRYSLK